MPLHNAGYQHWKGEHRGIWYRRFTIAANGLRGCLRNKWMRHLVVVCWTGALLQTGLLFLVGQLLVKDSMMVSWTGRLNTQLQLFANGLTTWLEQHPEISVRCAQNLLFHYYATALLGLSFAAIAMVIPHLVSRDLSSNAIVIYSSKAVSRLDYLFGKWGAVFGLLVLTWLGPMLASWFIGNLLAPRWHFFWHARIALGHVLVFSLLTMAILSILALGISAISHREKVSVGIWLALWLLGRSFVDLAEHGKPWLKHLSLSFNLDQLALVIFRLGQDLKLAQENIPIFGNMLSGVKARTIEQLQHPDWGGAVFALSILLILMVVILLWRVKPQ
jgi:ABC-type transport system involved in multi-copper enzyme maturation permease subunit